MRISNNLQRLINKAEKLNLYFNDIESYKGYYKFTSAYVSYTFKTQKELKDWLKDVVID